MLSVLCLLKGPCGIEGKKWASDDLLLRPACHVLRYKGYSSVSLRPSVLYASRAMAPGN